MTDIHFEPSLKQTKYRICYFCEEPFTGEIDDPISNYNGLIICVRCDYMLPIQYDIEEKGKCSSCFEETDLVKLPTCVHKLCLQCCKTIYFGSSFISDRPPHWRETIRNPPPWTFAKEDTSKQIEYYDYENEHFIYQAQSYDELVLSRDLSISYRPKWMNSPEFIEYENKCFRYHDEREKAIKAWSHYSESKTRGNGKCPLCRCLPCPY